MYQFVLRKTTESECVLPLAYDGINPKFFNGDGESRVAQYKLPENYELLFKPDPKHEQTCTELATWVREIYKLDTVSNTNSNFIIPQYQKTVTASQPKKNTEPSQEIKNNNPDFP